MKARKAMIIRSQIRDAVIAVDNFTRAYEKLKREKNEGQNKNTTNGTDRGISGIKPRLEGQ